MRLGYEVFYAKPGSVDEEFCTICGSKCEVTRNAYGPSSYAGAMARRFDLHDVFVCPHAGKEWHEQAVRLALAIEETPSKRVAELMRQDLRELVAENAK